MIIPLKVLRPTKTGISEISVFLRSLFVCKINWTQKGFRRKRRENPRKKTLRKLLSAVTSSQTSDYFYFLINLRVRAGQAGRAVISTDLEIRRNTDTLEGLLATVWTRNYPSDCLHSHTNAPSYLHTLAHAFTVTTLSHIGTSLPVYETHTHVHHHIRCNNTNSIPHSCTHSHTRIQVYLPRYS